MKIGITGHRPERIRGKQKKISEWLKNSFATLTRQRQEKEELVLLTGMAAGVDQIAALVALNLGIDVYCYFPYRHKLSMNEDFIAGQAAGIRYQCEKYQDGCFFERDRRIVDDCDVLMVVWDGKKNGGTWYTYKYAREKGKKLLMYYWGQEE